MRSKAPLALMEQMVMVLVFALAAALCLQAFALADRISRQNAERDQALSPHKMRRNRLNRSGATGIWLCACTAAPGTV